MFGWLKRGPRRPDTALAMIGARQSDQVLFLGAKDPSLAAETGAITRLNGRTVVAGTGKDAADRTDRAAAQAGAILEFVDTPLTSIPFDAGTFHLVVAPDASVWQAPGSTLMAESARVLRPGGRVILMVGEPARGFLGKSGPRTPAPPADSVLATLTRAGFTAARRLAEADGVEYYEARKSR